MEDNSEEEKQNYLRENIIDKGYDADDFVSFLAEKKGVEIEEGIDLNDFSLDEIKILVQDYIVAHSKEGEGEKKIDNTPEITPQIQNNLQQNINTVNPINTNNPLESPNMIKAQPPMMNINQNQNINMIPNYNINNMNLSPNSNINNLNGNSNNNMDNFKNMNLTPNNNNINNLNNFNMGMNLGINMNMNINMNNNLTINNNVNNNNMIQNIPNNTNNNINIQNNNNVNQQNESADIYGITNLDTIPCSISERSELSKYENIKIEMSLGEKVTGKIFSKAYMTFLITTSPLNLNVKRRYSDFEWLRQVLQNLYTSNIIPPIPKKKGGTRFDELFLLKRKRNLEKFLNCLLDDPYIKYSQLLFDFLSIEKESEFNDKKKYYNKLSMPKKLTEYNSPTGKLEITINEENELYFKSIKEYSDISQDLLTKFNKNIKLLNNEISLVVNRLEEISQLCEELFLKSVKYYDIDNIKISYYQLKNMFKDWSNLLKKQSCLVNVNIREYFKYTRNTFRSIKDLANTVDSYNDIYYKSKKKLTNKKEELFKKNDPRKWDLGPDNDANIDALLKDKNLALPKMLYKETNNVIEMKQIYGYYLNRVLSEYVRIRKLNGEGQKQNVSENAKFQTSIISELFKNISDIANGNSKYEIKNIEKELNISIS